MKRYDIVFLFVCFSLSLWGQEVATPPVPIETSSEQVRIEGKVYYIHLVLKKQTLYSISRHYGVGIEELQTLNPQLAEGLKEGDRLKIPVVKEHVFPQYEQTPSTSPKQSQPVSPSVLPVPSEPVAPASATTLPATHTAASPQLLDSVFSATPTKTQCVYLEEAHHECPVQDYNPETTTNRIALLLPFDNLSTTSAMLSDSLKEVLTGRIRASDNFMEFYAGALLAMEDMKQKGFSFHLSVYDSKNMDDVLNQDLLRYADLVIGPVYAASLEKFLPYAQQRKLNVVSPLDPKGESLLSGNPTLFQVPPPLCAQQEKLVSGISGKTDRVLLVYETDGNEDDLVHNYKTLLNAVTDSLVIFHYKVEKGLAVRDTLMTMLRSNTKNHIVVASNNEALVSDFTSNLSYIHAILKYPITLYGQSRWRNFENVDLSFFHSMNLHLTVPFYVDYQHEQVRNFVSRYRLQFHGEPSQYAFQGYDVCLYFLTALRNYGKDFANCLSSVHLDLLQGNYVFRRSATDAGYLNTGSCRVQYMPNYTINRQ